jgi:hypothetical protein
MEVVVVLSMLSTLFVAFARTLKASSGLASDSRATLMASDDERRSLDALAAELRGAQYLSLAGFDPSNGVATSPTFRRVLSANASGVVLDAPETLSWRASAASADGVTSAGEVVCTKGGVTEVMAPRVPQGGFRVKLAGNTLTITLTTFASTSQRVVRTTTVSTCVSLRN